MRYSILLSLVSFVSAGGLFADTVEEKQGQELFEKHIRPVLVKHCYACHSADADELGGNLYLDSRDGMRSGGETGPAVVPQDVKKSVLISALEYDGLEMPPEAQLPDEVIGHFRQWIKLGAPDPRNEQRPREALPTPSKPAELWSLEPLAHVAVPTVASADWPRTDIDRFILARLEAERLRPVADADPLRLLRRITFDLTGLPPTPEQVERVQSDSSPRMWESLVDKLLGSPAFGERWARHWLDVARYAESAGSSRDVLMPYAWKYRDYVIDAFNADLPYPQFITEQVAGDLLPADTPAERERLQIATGFLAVGQKSLNGGNLQLDVADDQVDVIGKAVLGLTISCARCHDHKFDPIPTQDYYALAGIFLSTDTRYGGGIKRPKSDNEKTKVYLVTGGRQSAAGDQRRALREEISKIEKQIPGLKKRLAAATKKLPKDWPAQHKALQERAENTGKQAQPLNKDEAALLERLDKAATAQQAVDKAEKELKQARARQKELPPLEFAVGVQEGKQVADTKVRIRGERNQQGQVAPRGFLQCVPVDEDTLYATSDVSPIDNSESGRRQLAAWLTAADNPLTPRVAVNRIWLHLFGRGLVESADNFGVSGAKPSHPRLLDYLAQRFIDHGWSTKRLIREIVLSRAYQLSTAHDNANYAVDPANQFRWRMTRRRLEAEAIRDAMLMASGTLQRERPPFGSAVAQIGEGEVGRKLNTKPLNAPFPYRSVYLPIVRGVLPEELSLFDFPDPANPQSVRDATNVPAQSLFFMNSRFVLRQADATARRVIESQRLRRDRILLAYQMILGREPSSDESARVYEFIDALLGDQQQDAAARQAAWSAACQALFATAEFRHLN